MPRPRRYTDDDLRKAIGESATLRDACRRLGVPPGGRTYELLRRNMTRLGIDASHLPMRESPARTRRSWTDDQLAEAVRNSVTWSGVHRRLGYEPNGGMHRYLTAEVRALGLDTSHFTGRAWSAGVRQSQVRRRHALAEVLVAGSTYPSAALRRRLVAAGIKGARCETCGLSEWRDAPITLTLDHINGDPTDNRLENLRILCPNCHAQTDTWCRRNVGRRTPTQRDQF